MRLRSVAIAVLLAAGGLGACSSRDAPDATPTTQPAPPATTSSVPAPAGAPTVRLLDAGAEPRSAVAYELVAGTVATAAFTSDLELEQGSAEARQRLDAPPVRQTVEHRVLEAGAEGATVEAEVLAIEVRPAGTGLTDAEVRELQRQLDPLVGTVTTSELGTRGEVLAVEADLPTGAGDEQQAQADGLASQVLGLAPVLPAEPIGAGARWEVVSTIEVAGEPATVTRTYTATAVDGDGLAWDLEVADASATTFEGRASGRVRWASPVGELEGTLSGTRTADGDDDALEQRIELAYRVELIDPSAG